MKLRAGDWVEVRSQDEILRTLDENGQLDGLPFMPEMLRYCGQRFQVWKRAHKTCDTVNRTGGRKMTAAVHLQELRCDGEAHGGCQAGCLLYWKKAWIKPSRQEGSSQSISSSHSSECNPGTSASGATAHKLFAGTRAEGNPEIANTTYICQATRLPYVTSLLPWWDIRQYWEDFRSGNVGLGRMAASFFYSGYVGLSQSGLFLGRPLRWLYDKFQSLRGGVPFPRRAGTAPKDQPTPVCALNLQPGEWVRIKSYREILSTLDEANRNRGLYFDCEEVPYCGGSYRVKSRVDRIINERSGKMLEMKTPSVILEGVYCQARYSDRRLFCPRSIYPMWREIWLERARVGHSESEEGDARTA
ncbi:MAG: hypothetical protein ABI569_09260 [Casimicrobiaceae bacterium]